MHLLIRLAITFSFGLIFLWIIFKAKKEAEQMKGGKKKNV